MWEELITSLELRKQGLSRPVLKAASYSHEYTHLLVLLPLVIESFAFRPRVIVYFIDCILLKTLKYYHIKSTHFVPTPHGRVIFKKLTVNQLYNKLSAFDIAWKYMHRVHMILPLHPIQSQFNQVHALIPDFFVIQFLYYSTIYI
jgi:hypothetical protein